MGAAANPGMGLPRAAMSGSTIRHASSIWSLRMKRDASPSSASWSSLWYASGIVWPANAES